MARRARDYIPLTEKLAAALACLLPQEVRDRLRADRVPAAQVISMFTPDHIHLHSLGGSDAWWNIDWRRRGAELNLKDRMDTTRSARAKRLSTEHEDFRRRVLGIRKIKKAKRYQWPKRKMR